MIAAPHDCRKGAPVANRPFQTYKSPATLSPRGPTRMGLLASLLSAVLATSKDLVSKRLAFRLDGMTSTYASFAYALPYYVLVLAVLWLLDRETFTCSLAFLWLVLLRSVTDTLAEAMKMHA